MPQRRLTIYGAIAVATPLLVLANALLSFADHALLSATTPLRPLLAEPPRLNAAAQTLAIAHRAWMMQPQARIVAENSQLFLEFYVPFNILEQGPDLTLVLVPDALSTDGEGAGGDRLLAPILDPRALPLGNMQATAGKHRYIIPAITDIGQYQAVVIWCAELDVMMGHATLEFDLSGAQ